jgi:sialidase-1
MLIGGLAAAVGSTALPAAVGATVEECRVISWKPALYHGWPTIARRSTGELLLVFSGGRESHVCPFGRVELMRSQDGGATWRWPQVLADGPIDDRDAGVMETPRGSIVVTTFTSLAYADQFEKARRIPAGQPGGWDEVKLREWTAVHERLSDDQRQNELGCWMLRSTDGGITWSARYRVPVNSPHGPIALRDGRLLYPGVSLWDDDRRVGVCASSDDGQSWDWLADIPARPGDKAADYHELHAVEAADGRIICHIRNHNPANTNETLQSESTDGGRTWSLPHPIGVWGLPSHLLRLRDGRLLMTYGYRRKPFGNQARVSADNGTTWGEPITLSHDGVTGDLGYPSTAECDEGWLVTVWYETLPDSPLAQLRQVRWRLKG